MKKLVVALALSALTSSAFAAHTGTYVGLGLGGSKLQTQKQDVTIVNGSETSKTGGLGGKIFTGYNFNQYAGIELGFATYAQSKYTADVTGVGSASKKYDMSALSLVGKGYLPLSDSNIDLYALGGAALVSSKVQVNQTASIYSNQAAGSASTTTRKVRPIVGVGINYAASNNISTALEYSHIQGMGNVKTNNRAIPNADMLSFNVSYNFE